MKHAGPPVGPERQAPYHGLVCQEIGAEEAAARGAGDEGELRAGFRGIRVTDTKCLDI